MQKFLKKDQTFIPRHLELQRQQIFTLSDTTDALLSNQSSHSTVSNMLKLPVQLNSSLRPESQSLLLTNDADTSHHLMRDSIDFTKTSSGLFMTTWSLFLRIAHSAMSVLAGQVMRKQLLQLQTHSSRSIHSGAAGYKILQSIRSDLAQWVQLFQIFYLSTHHLPQKKKHGLSLTVPDGQMLQLSFRWQPMNLTEAFQHLSNRSNQFAPM